MQFVDLGISREKFDREIDSFREAEAEYRKRGIILFDATFPRAVVGLFAVHIVYAPLMFGLQFDFSNYDVWPPSVTFVNPFTAMAVVVEQLPNGIPIVGRTAAIVGDGVEGQILVPQDLIQAHSGHPPFLCHRGVREYHWHPGHNGDPWALYRGGAEGRLARIVELVHKHGVGPARPEWQFQATFRGHRVSEPVP